MALRLRINGPQAATLGEHATRVFGVHGGRIGRAATNDWVLPDPERFLSGHHATIDHRAGQWYLVDTSSNGAFLNDATVPLGRGNAHVLQNGDRVRMGEYDFIVSVSADNDFPADTAGIAALDLSMDADFALATHGDIGAELDLKRLLSDPNPPADDAPPPFRVADAHGQALSVASARSAGRAGERPSAPARVAAGPTGHGGPVQAFFRGAGLDPSTMSPEQATAALVLAGQLVREMVLGLMTSQQHRAEQKGHFQIEDTARTPVEQNPLRVADSVEDGLKRLFGPRSMRFLPPLDAVRASFVDLRRHEQATQIAMQDGIAEFLRRLAPQDLEVQFAEAIARSGRPPANPGQRYWEMYGELYRLLAQTAPEGLPHAFAEEFAKAYEIASAELRQQDRRVRPTTIVRKP